MKKIIFVLIFMLIPFIIGCEKNNINDNGLKVQELSYDGIKDKLIRFHVIANSDTVEDQALKLKVRDTVIDFLSDKLENVSTLDQARKVLEDNIEVVNKIAKEEMVKNGYNYISKTMLSHENFPDKIYGNYVFPQGNYEAFRIIIGEGKGHNWWCVMFPPLCFVDETKDTVNSEKLDESINKITDDNPKKTDVRKKNSDGNKKNTEGEKDNSNSKNDSENNSEKKIKFKFKTVEKVKEILN